MAVRQIEMFESPAYRTAMAQAQRLSAQGWRMAAETIAEQAGLSLADVQGPRRDKQTVAVRRVVVRYLRAEGLSLPAIARLLRRDHTSVLHLLNSDGWHEKSNGGEA